MQRWCRFFPSPCGRGQGEGFPHHDLGAFDPCPLPPAPSPLPQGRLSDNRHDCAKHKSIFNHSCTQMHTDSIGSTNAWFADLPFVPDIVSVHQCASVVETACFAVRMPAHPAAMLAPMGTSPAMTWPWVSLTGNWNRAFRANKPSGDNGTPPEPALHIRSNRCRPPYAPVAASGRNLITLAEGTTSASSAAIA